MRNNKIGLGFILIALMSILLGFICIDSTKTKAELIEAKKVLNEHSELIHLKEENNKLSDSWKAIENQIKIKRDTIDKLHKELEVLNEEKLSIESKIQNNREKIIGKK